MKARSGFFKGTSGDMKFKLNIQFFASKAFDEKGHVSLESLKKYGEDFLDKSPEEVEKMMNEVGYKTVIVPSVRKESTSERVISINPSKDRNITQIQVSPDGSKHHWKTSYIKVLTKDVGIVKIVNGTKEQYINGEDEKAIIYFKGVKK